MSRFEVRHVLDIKAMLGECPLWSEEEQALIWLDPRKGALNRFDPVTGGNLAWQLPVDHPGAFALCPGGAGIATPSGFFHFDFATEKFDRLADVPIDPAVLRFNDGKQDRQGRFWIGTMAPGFKPDQPGVGTYYRYEAGNWTPAIHGIRIPNGTAFSPDGTVMYRAETLDRTIFACDLDIASGTVSNERVFAQLPDTFGMPDGATVDIEGGYWIAVPFGEVGQVIRFTPDGAMDLTIDLPVLAPTMVAFGGKDMATLFITSGRIEDLMGREHSPLGGDLFAVDTGYRGIAETLTPI
jgi:sugar lactone lactonase YvrE